MTARKQTRAHLQRRQSLATTHCIESALDGQIVAADRRTQDGAQSLCRERLCSVDVHNVLLSERGRCCQHVAQLLRTERRVRSDAKNTCLCFSCRRWSHDFAEFIRAESATLRTISTEAATVIGVPKTGPICRIPFVNKRRQITGLSYSGMPVLSRTKSRVSSSSS